jgi:hypothetical protein
MRLASMPSLATRLHNGPNITRLRRLNAETSPLPHINLIRVACRVSKLTTPWTVLSPLVSISKTVLAAVNTPNLIFLEIQKGGHWWMDSLGVRCFRTIQASGVEMVFKASRRRWLEV